MSPVYWGPYLWSILHYVMIKYSVKNRALYEDFLLKLLIPCPICDVHYQNAIKKISFRSWRSVNEWLYIFHDFVNKNKKINPDEVRTISPNTFEEAIILWKSRNIDYGWVMLTYIRIISPRYKPSKLLSFFKSLLYLINIKGIDEALNNGFGDYPPIRESDNISEWIGAYQKNKYATHYDSIFL